MICKIQSLGLTGINGYLVSVECFISNGLPGFEIVGLPDAAVKEARERVRAAIKSCGFSDVYKRQGHIKALFNGIELVGGTEILEKAKAFFSGLKMKNCII